MNPDGFLPDGTPIYFKTARGVENTALQLQMYADLMVQCDPKLCVDCHHFYYDNHDGNFRCVAGHNDIVGRYRKACEDFKEDE